MFSPHIPLTLPSAQLSVFLETFFRLNCREPGFFWLDSGNGEYLGNPNSQNQFTGESGGAALGRFAFFGLRPEYRLQYSSDRQLRCYPEAAEVMPAPVALPPAENRCCAPEQALEALRHLARRYRSEHAGSGSQHLLPFHSGLVGTVVYELGYLLHDYFRHGTAGRQAPDQNVPAELLLDFAAYPALLAVDLQLSQVYLTGQSKSNNFRCLQQKLSTALDALSNDQSANVPGAWEKKTAQAVWQLHQQYDFTAYRQKFDQVREYLRQGEIYQLNLSQKLRLRAATKDKSDKTGWESAALYLQLRHRHPVPFGAFCHLSDGRNLLSFSPERFFQLRWRGKARRIEARPMKGTRPRNARPGLDLRGYRELCQSPKERAELLMICDLLRNDLYRICEAASVRVDDGRAASDRIASEQTESWPFIIERYPSIWAQVASVSGTLRGVYPSRARGTEAPFPDLVALWQALFPCGSITGAPKLRAMELIRHLEPEPRHYYTGNLGYIDGSGNMEFNVLIRSFYEAAPAVLDYHVGSGLVWDSRPEEEWRELATKCRFFLDALGLEFGSASD